MLVVQPGGCGDFVEGEFNDTLGEDCLVRFKQRRFWAANGHGECIALEMELVSLYISLYEIRRSIIDLHCLHFFCRTKIMEP